MKLVVFATIALCMAFGQGCAFPGRDLIRSGYVRVDTQTKDAQKLQLGVYDDGGSLLVDGTLRDIRAAIRAHLDIEIVAPSGEVVGDAKVNFRRHAPPNASARARRSATATRTGGQHYHFTVRFPELPPEGSTVRASIDHSTHPSSTIDP